MKSTLFFVDAQGHFSKIANNYKDLRTTDLEPIVDIQNEVQDLKRIAMVDVGCGDGRYSFELCRILGDRLFLHCVDANNEMLKHLDAFLHSRKFTNFRTHQASAEELPFEPGSIDSVLTMNAIHHFNLLEFLTEVSRILVDQGSLFIYTRYRSQNKRNIWGQHFPLFNEKELRLYEQNELTDLIGKVPNMLLEKVKVFQYRRFSDIDTLIHQAENHHYSTFSLYDQEEFDRSISDFKLNLKSNFADTQRVEWTEENCLLTLRKSLNPS